MNRGIIPINKNYELEYRYYNKDSTYKYFNRKFEVYLLGKKAFKKHYILHMDNSDKSQMIPRVYKALQGKKRFDFGLTTLNWIDIKNNFLDILIEEIGEKERGNVKKAVGKLTSPKL